ncbi:MAG: RagB/SusD family nutrient uptake outer membrane protein [Bacteroidetes bacterium]|nr:MAG: RagB/SusD family nutrient uptake outer membrane protein [Bacteroidota bacterium]
MKRITYIHAVLISALTVCFYSCKKDYGNLNGPTIEQFSGNASESQLDNLLSGTLSGMRNNLAYYLDDVGSIGREGYRFSGSEPRYVTDLLGAGTTTLTNSNFYITDPWAARYRVVKNCNLLIEAATNSTLISDAEKNGYVGFARTIKAYQLLLNLNLTYSNGIRVDVADPNHLGPFVGYDDGLTAIAALLDSAKTDLSNASVVFPLPGFEAFGDAAGLSQVNRALAARVAIYRKQWSQALTAIGESFFDLTKNFYFGVNHVFSTGAGDQLNPMFIPQNQTGEIRVAHPSYAAEIEAGDDRIGKATLRSSVASLTGLSSDRDVWVYTSSTALLPIIRNEELILIYAEASIQSADLADGVKAINVIRSGHNLPPYSRAMTKDTLITEVLNQRRYSLFFEGHRWIDMRRYDKLGYLPLDRPNDHVWVEFPIPVGEN